MTLNRTNIAPDLIPKERAQDPRIGHWVKKIESPSPTKGPLHHCILFGCPDDTGVRLNHGRPGAKHGPDSIRRHLYKMALPMDTLIEKKVALFDLGNCVQDKSILVTHQNAKEMARAISGAKSTVIALGGGHDFGAPNFLGFLEGLGRKRKVGLINVDPHLDVRPLENGEPHSGTPFRQILDSQCIAGKDLTQFGTCTNRNARAHFQYAKENKVTILSLETILRAKSSPITQFQALIKKLKSKYEVIACTIDMDTCQDAEGTSAAPVVGFTAWQLREFAFALGRERKVAYLEIAETAPELDSTERSSRIAAEVIYAFLLGRAS